MSTTSKQNKLREVFNEKSVKYFSEQIKKNYPQFDKKSFDKEILQKLDNLELKARSNLIRDNLVKFLPQNFQQAAKILVDSLEKENNPYEKTEWQSFMIMPQADFIALKGIDDFENSMKVLYEMTKRFSAEFAIRHFIIKYPEQSIELLKIWAQDKNYHIRRLSSEGVRPRLPWACALNQFKKNPQEIIEILEILKDDKELYVRKSVANNLNDIAKDNEKIVIELLKKWKKNATKERVWIINHALRGLFKKGNKDALELMDYKNPKILNPKISLENNRILFEEDLLFEVNFAAQESQKLMIDYVIHFVKSNQKSNPKVFKLSKKNVKAGELVKIKSKHSFKSRTTRKHYEGEHFIEIMINGLKFEKASFALKKAK